MTKCRLASAVIHCNTLQHSATHNILHHVMVRRRHAGTSHMPSCHMSATHWSHYITAFLSGQGIPGVNSLDVRRSINQNVHRSMSDYDVPQPVFIISILPLSCTPFRISQGVLGGGRENRYVQRRIELNGTWIHIP